MESLLKRFRRTTCSMMKLNLAHSQPMGTLIVEGLHQPFRALAYRKVQECLLDSLFRPSAKDVEKSFKVKGKQKRTVGDGTSKGYGNNNVTYTENHYNSVYWGE